MFVNADGSLFENNQTFNHLSVYSAIYLVNKFSLITYYLLQNVLDAAYIMVSKARIVAIFMENLQTSENDLNRQP